MLLLAVLGAGLLAAPNDEMASVPARLATIEADLPQASERRDLPRIVALANLAPDETNAARVWQAFDRVLADLKLDRRSQGWASTRLETVVRAGAESSSPSLFTLAPRELVFRLGHRGPKALVARVVEAAPAPEGPGDWQRVRPFLADMGWCEAKALDDFAAQQATASRLAAVNKQLADSGFADDLTRIGVLLAPNREPARPEELASAWAAFCASRGRLLENVSLAEAAAAARQLCVAFAKTDAAGGATIEARHCANWTARPRCR
jgi:hypothetical protein